MKSHVRPLRQQRSVLTTAVCITAIVGAGLFTSGCIPSNAVLKGHIAATSGSAANVPVGVYTNDTNTVVAQTTTDGAGNFGFDTAALPDGTYRVRFSDADWWQGASDWSSATPVVVSAASPVTINTTLAIPSGSISGSVTSGANPIGGASVRAINTASGTTTATATTASDGTYSFADLPPADYVLRFQAAGYSIVYNNGVPTRSVAQPIHISNGTVRTGVNVLLAAQSVITGTVAHGTTPMDDVLVIAFDKGTGEGVNATITDANGHFQIDSLGIFTNYTIEAIDLTSVYSPLVVGSTSTDPTTGTSFMPTGAALDAGTIDLGYPAGAPGAPTITNVSSGDRQASVTWAAPADTGSSPITTYTVTSSPGGKTCVTTGALTCTVTGLTNATTYTFTVTATNDAGTGPASGASTAVTPSGCAVPAGPGVDWTACDLSGVDLTGADLTNANLDGANLSGTTLTGATLTGVHSGGLTGTPTGLPNGWQITNGYLIGPGANLDGAVLTTNDLTFSTRLNLSNVNFSNASLVNANLIGTTIWNANLAGANLTGANLYGADIRYTDLTGAILTNVNFDGPAANVAGTTLLYNTLTGITSGGITGHPHLIDMGAQAWDVTGGYLVGPGVDLSGIDLRGLDFAGGNLNGVNLAGANMSGLDLTNTRFSGANLTGTNLSGTTLTGAASGAIVGTPLNLPAPWYLTATGYLIGPAANLSSADLTGLDLSTGQLTGANFAGANLTSVNLSGLDLTGANFAGATMTGTQLSGTTLTGAQSGGIIGTPLGLASFWNLTGGYLAGPGVDFAGLDLTGLDFTGVDFTGANLSGATLTNTILDATQLGAANIAGVTSGGITGTPASLPTNIVLVNGFLVGSNFDLHGAAFTGANLTGVDLTGSNLSGATFTGSNLTGANLTNADLTGATIATSTITNTNFSGATLTGLISQGNSGSPINLPTGWTSANGYLIGPGANLSGLTITGVDFTGVDFTGVNLTGTNLVNVNLSGAKLANATLTGLISSGIVGTPASLPTGFSVNTGYLIGPGTNLSGKDLTGVTVTSLSLNGVNLTGANLSSLDLHSVDLTGATLAGANLHAANLDGANLTLDIPTFSSRLNLNNVDLSNASLIGADLNGSSLWYVNLGGANLTGANLYGSDIRYSNLSGATLTNVNFDGPYASATGTYLIDDTFTGITSGGITGQPFLISTSDGTNWQVVGGYLIQVG